MKNNKLQILNLKKQLSQFGLNPEDWSLTPRSNDTYMLKHKEQLSFQFLGEVIRKTGGWDWQKLNLISL